MSRDQVPGPVRCGHCAGTGRGRSHIRVRPRRIRCGGASENTPRSAGRLLPRVRTRLRAGADLSRRRRLRRVVADARANGRDLWLALPCVLRDAEPLPPVDRDARTDAKRRHATSQRLVRAAVQLALRRFRPRLPRALPSELDRQRAPFPRDVPVHRAESGPGGSSGRARELALEQLPRNGRFPSAAGLPGDRHDSRGVRSARRKRARAIPAVRCGGTCPGTWSRDRASKTPPLPRHARVSSLNTCDWPGSRRTKLRPIDHR